MTDIEYRIKVDEDSYHFNQDEYDAYVTDRKKDIAQHGIYAYQTIHSPQELKKIHLENVLNCITGRRYTNLKAAQRYIKSISTKHYSFVDFYLEYVELDWKRL